MPRPAGRRNADYEATRTALVERLTAALTRPGGTRLSFRQLAEAAGVSATTLRHYFATRDQVVAEVLAAMHRAGLPYLHAAATTPARGARTSLRWFVGYVMDGWREGVGAVHALGLTEGLGHDTLGPAYLREVLEPTLQAAEARLARHVADGELGRCDVRHAAIELVSPIVVALMHQDTLGGSRCRPLDLQAFAEEHVERFLRAHAPKLRPAGA